jgi:hypothetical protein
MKDRWGGTPVSEAAWHGHDECVRIMRKAGGQVGTVAHLRQGKETKFDEED